MPRDHVDAAVGATEDARPCRVVARSAVRRGRASRARRAVVGLGALGVLGVLAAGCQDVSIGRQRPRDDGVDVRRERVLPLPEAELTLRALDVGPSGEVVLLGQLTGSADLGDGVIHTATTDGGDGVLLVFEPDGTLRSRRVLTAEFLTVYRAAVAGDRVHITGLFRGALSDGAPIGDAPTGQAAVRLAYSLDGARVDARVLASAAGQQNVQGKGVDGRGDRVVWCGNYLGQIDAGDGPVDDAGLRGDNAYVTVADAGGTIFTDAFVTPEGSSRGAYGQNCALAADDGAFVAVDFDAEVATQGGVRVADGLDGLVARYGADGAGGWVRMIGGPGDQQLSPIAVRSERVLVAGTSTAAFDVDGVAVEGGAFVLALEADGAAGWAWSADGPSAVTSIDASGVDTIVSGFFGAPVDALGWTNRGAIDGFVLGLDDEGHARWSHTFGSAAADRCLAHASGAEVVVVCAFGGALESPAGTPIPDGGALWIGHVAVGG